MRKPLVPSVFVCFFGPYRRPMVDDNLPTAGALYVTWPEMFCNF